MNAICTHQVRAAQHRIGAFASAANQQVTATQSGLRMISKFPIAPIFSKQRTRQMFGPMLFGLGILLSTAMAVPAVAASKPTARLVKCGAENCLAVSGQRADKTANVLLNGHEVSPKGKHGWHIRVPVETIRTWSAPYARTIAVSVAGITYDAKLPIGLMGHADLARLVVRVK